MPKGAIGDIEGERSVEGGRLVAKSGVSRR
jgi:hypothetical protein